MRNNAPSTKLAAAEESSWMTSNSGFISTTMGDSNAAPYVGILFTHAYSNPPYTPYPYQNLGLHLWMTENSFNPEDTRTIGTTLQITDRVHEIIVDGNANLYEWETNEIIDAAFWGYSGLLNDHVPSLSYYGYGQYTQFVRPGWHLYGATEHPDSGGNVNLSFFRSNTTNDLAIVAINNNSSTTPLNFVFNGFTAPTVTPYTTSGSLSLAQQTSVSAGSSFNYTLPAQSVTTFVGTANSATIAALVGPS